MWVVAEFQLCGFLWTKTTAHEISFHILVRQKEEEVGKGKKTHFPPTYENTKSDVVLKNPRHTSCVQERNCPKIK